MATLKPKFVWEHANHFDAKSSTVKDVDGKVVFNLHPGVIENIFKVLETSECIDLTK